MAIILNFVLFQIGWFSAILNAAYNQAWVGALVILAILIYRLKVTHERVGEFMLMLSAGLIGFLFETIFIFADVYHTFGYTTSQILPPYWLIIMWPNLAAVLNASLKWLSHRYALAALFGALGGPPAYLAANAFGAIDLSSGLLPIAAMAVGWGIVTPTLVFVRDYLIPPKMPREDS